MKQGSDNYRSSAIKDIIKKVIAEGIEVVVYEPSLKEDTFYNSKILNCLDEFILKSDLIVTNRMSDDLKKVQDKVFTRDIFGEN